MPATAKKAIFDELFELNVNGHTEQKNTGKTTLTYLSWPWAWAEVKKRCPDAHYEVIKNQDNLPYFVDPQLGIMVYTTVTIDGVTHEMWLPVMDGANNAMKIEPYEITTKFGSKPVAAATMFDVNKTIMRCLVKNLAMFGLGLYIYAGEDLPEESDEARKAREEEEALAAQVKADTIKQIDALVRQATAKMSTDEKKQFAEKVIIPIIGQINYKTCPDQMKLTALLSKLKGDE